jgi:hypothetical protein
MRRAYLALVLASLALVAAVVGALGPAEKIRTSFSWPPETMPTGTPARLWYTPLLLVRRQPEELRARLPCALPPSLPDAERPETVLATARFPERANALFIRRAGDRLLIGVGGSMLDRVSIPDGASDRDCAYRLTIGSGRWSIEGGPNQVSRDGEIDAPVVAGLFSALDLRSEASPSVDITTVAHATRTTTRQKAAWTIAALLAVVALLLVTVSRRPQRVWPRAAILIRTAVKRAHAADGVVAVALVGWWVIGPAYYDDGWVVARQSMFSGSAGFSNYYDSFAANHPLGYWLEWAQHWFVEVSHAMLVLRVPALVCLAATWVLARWILSQAVRSSVGESGTALWALAAAFVAGALAWGMTLRPEPAIALLVTAVLACTIRFVQRETAAPLALAGIFIALALTAHPSGVVTFGSLLVVVPRLFRWARRRLAVAASIVVANAALLVVLGFIGSDAAQRRHDAGTIRTYGNAVASWREEINRYADLYTPQYGTPLRREAVALMILAVLAYALRSRRERQALLDLPALGLGLALLLLIPTPSKWPWHFGTLIGLAAVAVASETARLRDEARRSPGWSARPFIVVGAAIVAAAWAWSPRHIWSELDLRTLDWTLGFETKFLTLSKIAAAVPLALLVAVGLFELARGGRKRLQLAPWRVATWTALAMTVPLVAFTAGVFVIDATRSPNWTLARQNLETLRGDLDCGLVDDAHVALGSSMRPASASSANGVTPSVPGWVPAPPIDGLARFSLGPVGPGSVARSPWLPVPAGPKVGMFLAGEARFAGTPELEWGRVRNGGIDSLEGDAIAAALESEVRADFVQWRFFPAAELPPRPQGATLVRVALRGAVGLSSAVAITAPLSYSNEPLRGRLARSGARTLVPPNFLTYVPCVDLPRLENGAVEVPKQIISPRDTLWPVFGRDTSPFESLLDLYRLERLPFADSQYPPGNLVLYDVDRLIPGAVVLPPDATALVS